MDRRSGAGRLASPAAVLRRRLLCQPGEPDPDRGDLRAESQFAGGLWRDDVARTRLLSWHRRLSFRAADKPIRIRPWPRRDRLDRGYDRDGGVLRRHRAPRHRAGLPHDHAGLVAGAVGAGLSHVRRDQRRQRNSRPDPAGAVWHFTRQRGIVLLVRTDRDIVRLRDDGDFRVLVVRVVVEGCARSAAPDGCAGLQSLDDPLDHLHLCRFLGRHIRTALRLLQQIHPPDVAFDHQFGRGIARRYRRRLGNARWSGGRRRAGAAAEELRLGLYRTMEHAARSGVPVHRSGDADRNRPWLGQTNAPEIAMTQLASDHALEVINLKKAFGGLVVTQDVSLAIRPGERRLIIGPNGAGKTTLFNQISGDMRPNSGQIKLFGSDITQLTPYKRAHCGLSRTYQIITLFTGDTLEHNVTLGLLGLRSSRWQMWRQLSFYGDLTAEAHRTLDAVGLLHLAAHPVSDIASGEKRRVELAMALAQKPRVLLLDEPLAGLSNTERSQVKSLIASIPRETTVIMIEHDMDTALDLAETVTLLNYGRVIVDGDRDSVIADERTREVYLGV